MNELLTALVAASKVGFDAPRCRPCIERPVARFTLEGEPLPELVYCPTCQGTSLDASDPERLGFRAIVWLRNRMVQVSIATYRGGDLGELHAVAVAFRDSTKPMMQEEHEDTPAGLATALLRLVARAGGAA